MSVSPALEILNSSDLDSGKVGKAYSCTFTTDSTYPAFWSLTDGVLPDGLALTGATLSGTPTTDGTFTFTLSVEAGGLSASKEFTLKISPALSITTDAILPSVKLGSYYSFTLESDADNPNSVLWSLVDSSSSGTSYTSLPSGMYIDETTGTIYGNPTAEGVYKFTVQAVMGNVTATKDFTLSVRPTLTITTESPLPHAKTNELYSVVLNTDADEDQVVTWSLTAGSLLEGLSLDKDTGTISGYPLNEGRSTFTIEAFSNSLRVSKEFVLTAGAELNIITSSAIPVLEAGTDFMLALETDRPSNDSVWSVVSGMLPPGLNLDAGTGIISGKPERAGTYTFTVQNVSGYSEAQKEFVITVGFVITSAAYLPNGTTGQPYKYTFTADGVSTGSVLWIASGDTFPTGLTLSTGGVLSGITNEAGTYDFMVYAFVSNDVSAYKVIKLTIDSYSALPITTAQLPDGQVSKDYYAELTSSVEGVTWSADVSALPTGLTLSPAGLISGIPTEADTFRFMVKASTSTREGSKQLSITIAPEPEPEKEVSSSGGGCDSGFGLMGLALVLMMFRRR